MFVKIKPVSLLSFLKGAFLLIVAFWAVTATILLIRLRPSALLIGIDSYGVRLITNDTDRLLKLERENFIKRYLTYSYTYSSTDFEQRISQAGEMMAKKLWDERTKEFLELAKKLKKHELTQESKIMELREVDADNFEVDLDVKIRTKLQEVNTKLRIEIRLAHSSRTEENPYRYEVANYVEHVLD